MKKRIGANILLSMLFLIYSGAHADDVSKGRDYFLNQCVACHAFACNKEGWTYAPRLGGLFGRKAGGVEDFTGYTEGFKKSTIVWTDKTLDEFFKDPSAIDPKTQMIENGTIANADTRRQIIAYLKTEDPSVDLFCPK